MPHGSIAPVERETKNTSHLFPFCTAQMGTDSREIRKKKRVNLSSGGTEIVSVSQKELMSEED
jgi:hypothetical protein